MLGGVLNRMAVTARTDNSGKDGARHLCFLGLGARDYRSCKTYGMHGLRDPTSAVAGTVSRAQALQSCAHSSRSKLARS